MTCAAPVACVKPAWVVQVLVYEPPEAMQSEWGVAADLGAKLLSYLESSGWRVRAQGRRRHLLGMHVYLPPRLPCPFSTFALL